MNSKYRPIITRILSGFIAFIFISSGLFKLFGGESVAELVDAVGGQGNLTFLGILEILIAVLFLIKRTGLVGALLMIAYMAGAMAVHFVKHEPLTTPLIIQIMVWVVSAYRFPELRTRLFTGNLKTAE